MDEENFQICNMLASYGGQNKDEIDEDEEDEEDQDEEGEGQLLEGKLFAKRPPTTAAAAATTTTGSLFDSRDEDNDDDAISNRAARSKSTGMRIEDIIRQAEQFYDISGRLMTAKQRREQRKERPIDWKKSIEALTAKYTDQKMLSQRNAYMLTILEQVEQQSSVDLKVFEQSALIIYLLMKNMKTSREITFLSKFMRTLSVFQDRQELLEASSLSNLIVQSLRCVFVRKHARLFNYGDRGDEYYILLKGKAFCLIPALSIMTYEEATSQVKHLVNTIEDKEDEDYLVKSYPRMQCVKIYQPGQAFGEIALLTSESKRMASIVCKEDCYFLSLNREGFDRVLGSYQQHILNEKVDFLKSISLFSSIASNKICAFLQSSNLERTYELKQPIYSFGDRMTKIYFILSGQVELIADLTLLASSTSSSALTSPPNQIKYPSKKHNKNDPLKQQEHTTDSTENYSQFFSPNSRTSRYRKTLVRLNANSYFGDEDLDTSRVNLPGISTQTITSTSKSMRHRYSAIAVCENTRILEFDLHTLTQFLKANELYTAFKNASHERASLYASVISKDTRFPAEQISLSRQKSNEDNIKHPERKQPHIQQQLPQSQLEPIQYLQHIQNEQQLQQQPQEYIEQAISDQKLAEKSKYLTGSPLPIGSAKFKNVFHKLSSSNIKGTNFLASSNVHTSSCPFTIDDIPKTYLMNFTPEDLRRIRFRFAKKTQFNAASASKFASFGGITVPNQQQTTLSLKQIPNSTTSASISQSPLLLPPNLNRRKSRTINRIDFDQSSIIKSQSYNSSRQQSPNSSFNKQDDPQQTIIKKSYHSRQPSDAITTFELSPSRSLSSELLSPDSIFTGEDRGKQKVKDKKRISDEINTEKESRISNSNKLINKNLNLLSKALLFPKESRSNTIIFNQQFDKSQQSVSCCVSPNTSFRQNENIGLIRQNQSTISTSHGGIEINQQKLQQQQQQLPFMPYLPNLPSIINSDDLLLPESNNRSTQILPKYESMKPFDSQMNPLWSPILKSPFLRSKAFSCANNNIINSASIISNNQKKNNDSNSSNNFSLRNICSEGNYNNKSLSNSNSMSNYNIKNNQNNNSNMSSSFKSARSPCISGHDYYEQIFKKRQLKQLDTPLRNLFGTQGASQIASPSFAIPHPLSVHSFQFPPS